MKRKRGGGGGEEEEALVFSFRLCEMTAYVLCNIERDYDVRRMTKVVRFLYAVHVDGERSLLTALNV